MTIDAALEICAKRFLALQEVADLCATTDTDPNTALDTLAREVATRYLQETTTFLAADTIMTDLFTHAVTHADASPFFMRVYEAFDQGEYSHTGDDSGADAEAIYTRPMLTALVAEGLLPHTSR